MYSDADIEQNEAIRNAPRKPAGKVEKRAVEMLDSNYEWRSIGLQEVELRRMTAGYNWWFLAGQDREVAPAGTENPCDGYRFAAKKEVSNGRS